MNKKELFQALWVPIEKRLPDNKEEFPILIKLESGGFTISNSKVFNAQQEQLRLGNVHISEIAFLKQSGYFAIAWMRLY